MGDAGRGHGKAEMRSTAGELQGPGETQGVVGRARQGSAGSAASVARGSAGRMGSVASVDWPPSSQVPCGTPKEEVTISLIGGQRLLRDATASLLASEEGLRMLGTFESADHFLQAGIEEPPAVLLLDCDEDDSACWQSAIERLSSTAQVQCGLVMLCGEMCEEAIRCALEQRVNGVILKSYPTQQIRESIAYVATGRTVMPAGCQLALTDGWKKPLGLSPRHRQVLALMAQGQCNDQIATTLELSPNTVKFHIRALYERLGVHNRVEAANRYAQMPSGDS
jgi:two-component system, NarL family, response regulator DesR